MNKSIDGNKTNTTSNPALGTLGIFYNTDPLVICEIMVAVMIGLIAFPGNALLLVVQMKNKSKTTTDYMVMSMAGVEFICSFMQLSFHFARNFHRFTNETCRLFVFSAFFTAYTSAMLLAAVAIDRYVKICLPLNQFYNVTIAKRVSSVLLFVGFIIASPSLFFISYNEEIERCKASQKYDSLNKLFTVFLAILNIIIFIVISTSYLRIAIVLRKRQIKRKKQKTATECVLKSITPSNTSDSIQRLSFTDIAKSTESKQELGKHKGAESPNFSEPPYNKEDTGDTAKSTNKDGNLTDINSLRNSGPYTISTEGPNTEKSHMKKKETKLNKTTRIMFSISMIYLVSWSWICVMIVTNNTLDKTLNTISALFSYTNCMANPLLFTIMSSKFRENAKRLVCCK